MSKTVVNPVTVLPSHLGWESKAFTQTLRQSQQRKERERAKHKPLVAEKLVKQTISYQSTKLSVSQTQVNTVKHYPSIGIAALKADQAPNYRVWLMCRYLDVQGRGWLEVEAECGKSIGNYQTLCKKGRRGTAAIGLRRCILQMGRKQVGH